MCSGGISGHLLSTSPRRDLRVQQASRPDYRVPSPTLAALPIALTLITLTLIVEGC